MLNEEKIRLMTKAAAFETKEGKKALSMNKYFRGDYISLNLIAGGLSFTVAFLLCAGLWALYNMEELMENLHRMDVMAFGKGILLLYLALLGIFLVIQYAVYHVRYMENRRKMMVYQKLLKRISKIYETEAKNANVEQRTEGVREDDDLTGI